MHNSTKFLGVPCSQGYRWTIIFRVCNNLLSIFNLKCAITKRSIFNLAILGKVCLYRVYLTQHKNNFIICFYKGLKRAIDNAMTFYGFNAKLIRYVFFKNEFFHQLEKWRDDPEIPKKVIFLCYFPVENMLSPNIWDCLVNILLLKSYL